MFPDSFLGLEIRNVDTENVFPLDAQPSVVTFQPGASATFEFTYESLVDEIGAGLISATVPSQCDTAEEEVTFSLSAPEIVAFCNEFSSLEVHCYQSSLEDCIIGEGLFNVEDPDCEGVETVPSGDLVGLCRVENSPQGELFAVCSF
ncbi:MAG: hypothetical protein M3311_05570 [Thermoproteota archaeon]|nr:hypothetical protein [Thermoproteota archaeon]